MPNAPKKKMTALTADTSPSKPDPNQLLQQALRLVLSAKDALQGPKQLQVGELADKLHRILKEEEPFQSPTTLLEKLVKQVAEQGRAIAQLSNKSVTSPPQQMSKGKEMSYAQAAQSNLPSPAQRNSPPYPTVPSSATEPRPFVTVTSKKSQKEDLRKRQLVLITSDEDRNQPLNSLALRNQINEQFITAAKAEKPVLASITKSGKQNIILTTTAPFDADFLNQHQALWKPLFKFTREQKMESWAQIIAHGVPFESVFLEENGATALKEEIETFNDISVVGRVRWLSKKRRENQQAGSIVFAVASEEIRATILRGQRITIAGHTATIVKYLPSLPSAQCGRCQRFGHATDSCRSTACRFCAASHKTGEHQCSSCNTVGRPCEHTAAKCINCKGSHFANSPACEIWKAAKNIHHH